MPNRLADAVSPYLLAHAQNPVDWHPWGEEALAEARERDVPLFISIGYATCHWCHVMARESFSNEAVAAKLNAGFVPVKVDREEHPDVDAAYLAAASAFTPNLGWPLSVFAMPDGKAFFAGTYFPPEPRTGLPSFAQVLDAVTDAYTRRRDDVASTAAQVASAVDSLRRRSQADTAGAGDVDSVESSVLDRQRLKGTVADLVAAEDPEFGGFAAPPEFNGPKFPAVPVLAFLLDSGDALGERTALHTLGCMARSPLRDAVDGGFFRYGTRRDWGVPHYERMLYDNAGLLRLYADAAASLDPELASIAEGIASFLTGTMRVEGGFASAQDSESEVDGERREGLYYRLDAAQRAAQPRPALDAKVLTGWNGIAIGALAHAGALLGHPEWVREAAEVADGLLSAHVSDHGRMLLRASLDGRASAAAPALDDYGLFASGLLDVFLATGEHRFASAARTLVDATLVDATLDAATTDGASPDERVFAVPGGGDSVLSAHGLVADADPSEGAHQGGTSSLADACRVLFALTDDAGYDRAARTAIGDLGESAVRSPLAFGGALRVASALDDDLRQLVVVTPDGGEPAIVRAVAARGRSLGAGTVGVVVSQGRASALAADGFELFADRSTIGGIATEYLCRAFSCELPRPFSA
ncbi:thioredoxin domain-containing protein [Humibacter ginsenosidimutans]|uniref:Thioredoxin domain-containing protein n=1 Tax=Humibacter ginsenosidimutans TaxID=2599293 RepID=A0A5B8M321_9MICO|nr:DUF255 domain-containing protein [Humibacter ginsenosidimutans]QDZ14551.1 thioredoxin domain-containing protein [Humibacter ginsenosidimutans]